MNSTAQTTTVSLCELKSLFTEWTEERAKVEALVYGIQALMRQGEQDRPNESMLLEVIVDILSTTKVVSSYKKSLLGGAQ